MAALYPAFAKGLDLLIEYSILLLDFLGVAALLFAASRAVVQLVHKGLLVRLRLAEGIALALEFKLGGEVLRTSLVRDPRELIILGAIILLRAAIALLIRWEIKTERHENELDKK